MSWIQTEHIDFSSLVKYASRCLSPGLFERLLENRAADHCPQYHELGLLGHAYAVIKAWQMLEKQTRVAGEKVAVLHDVGKISAFAKACELVDAGQAPNSAYFGHEKVSAEYARSRNLDSRFCSVIACHGRAYDFTYPLEKLVQKISGPNIARLWIQLCTADSVAKGWTQAQTEQRPLIADKFRELAERVRIPKGDSCLEICVDATASWQLPSIGDFGDLRRFAVAGEAKRGQV